MVMGVAVLDPVMVDAKQPRESVALIEKVKLPNVVGVPDSTPVVESSVSPNGNLPEITVKV